MTAALLYAYATCKFGLTDLRKFKVTGPYKVGYTEKFKVSNGNFCAVFYPVDDDEVSTTNQVKHGCLFGPNVDETMAENLLWGETITLSGCLRFLAVKIIAASFKALNSVYFSAVVNGRLAMDFTGT